MRTPRAFLSRLSVLLLLLTAVGCASQPTKVKPAAIQIQDGLNLLTDACHPRGAWGVQLGAFGFMKRQGCQYKWAFVARLTCPDGTPAPSKKVRAQILGDIQEYIYNGEATVDSSGRIVLEFESRSLLRKAQVQLLFPGQSKPENASTEDKEIHLSAQACATTAG